MELDNMFDSQSEEQATGTRSLDGTARLTSIASEITSHIIHELNDNVDEHREMFIASKSSHNAMDELITKLGDLDSADTSFITELPEETQEAMLKSQQSKRSRLKGKQMTLENYKSLMVGAVAENLIRIACNKPKLAGGARRSAGDVSYSEEQLAVLAENQDELKKHLRNIQSKKSIAKSKEGFDPESAHWQQLLEAEAALKAIRVSTGRTVKVDETKKKVEEMLSGDIDKVSKKDLIAKLHDLVSADAEPAAEPEPVEA